jgi:uncharacterized Zn-finger protein
VIDRYYQYQSLYLRLLAEKEIGSPAAQTSDEPEHQQEERNRSRRLVSSGEAPGYFCPRCGNAYSRPHSLNRHIRFECGVEPQFECPVCHKRSKHKHNLVLHMRTHQKS